MKRMYKTFVTALSVFLFIGMMQTPVVAVTPDENISDGQVEIIEIPTQTDGNSETNYENAKEDSLVNLKEANELIKRWLSEDQVNQFELRAIDPAEYEQETFKISSSSDKLIVIGGTSTSALLMGWNWYMKYEANSNISFNGENIDLNKTLPLPEQEIVKHSSVEHRFGLNDTDEGYNDPYANWEDWQRKIDILAMHGINEVLVYPGQEAVYQETFKDFGYSELEMRNWIAGPAHQPWWLMQNLSTFPQAIPQEAIDKRVELGQKITSRLKELGMTPVLPGYYGMVPFNLKDKYPEANIVDQGTYHNLEQPDWLDTTSDLYAEIAATYYQHQSDLFGDTDMFKMDLFHEGGKNGNVDIGEATIAVQEALNTAYPEGIWVHLGWHKNPLPESVAVLDKDKTLILDGIADRDEAKNREEDWNDIPYAFGTIWNFGGHTNMGANLTVWNEKFHEWKNKDNSALSGIALIPEAINNNPFAVEFFAELPWHEESQDLDKWVEDFVTGRYGTSDPEAIKAWKAIQNTAYDLPANNDSQRTTDIYSSRPSLNFDFPYWKEDLNYDTTEFEKALSGLLNTDSELRNSSAYHYDLMDVTRTVLGNRGRTLLPKIKAAYETNDKELFAELSKQFLHYIDLTDQVTATNEHSMLGPWLDKAKNFVSDEELGKQLEYDAKSLITIWSPNNSLNDYGRRQWSGLTGDYYYSRWETYFNSIGAALETNTEPESTDWYKFGEDWVEKSENYPLETQGDVFEISNNVHNELKDQLIAELMVSSDQRVITNDSNTITIKASFVNKNGLNTVENINLKLNAPDGYIVGPPTDTSVNDELNIEWEVMIPENLNKEATETFKVTASYKNEEESKEISEDLIFFVENEIQAPFKTVSHNDSLFSQSESGDEFAIYGGGEDWWKSFDEFGAIYKEDAFKTYDTAIVKVEHQDNTSPYARAGIVVRNDLTQKETPGYLNLSVTPENGVRISWDSNGDGRVDKNKDLSTLSAPVYLKLSRDGSSFTGSASKDGKVWTKIGTVDVPGTKETQDIGLAMSAVNRHSDELGVVSFSEFEIDADSHMYSFDSSQQKIPKGMPVNINTTFENVLEQTVENMNTSLDVPNTWEVKNITSVENAKILPGDKVEQTWQVVVPADVEFNRYNIKASATFDVDGVEMNTEDIIPVELITAKNTLAEAFNNVGITDDNNPGRGNLDTIISFSAQSLAKHGFSPGSTVIYDGMEFEWPNVQAGTPDNVKGQAAIQTDIKGDKLSFIGTAVGTKTADQQGQGTLVYSDGSTEEFTIKLENYYAGKTPSENSVVATDGRNKPSGPVNLNYKYQMLYHTVSLNPDKTLSAVVLPDKASMHIFSMTAIKVATVNDLEILIAEIKSMDLSAYTDESVANLNDAIAAAEAVLADKDATQNDIDAQVLALQTAVDALEEKVLVDTSVLEAKITKTKAMDLSDYTDSSVEILRDAITTAEEVLADVDATQDEVDAQVLALQTAIDALEEKVDVPVSDYDTALAALRKADSSRSPEDIQLAKDLANSMNNGWQKNRLVNRLNVIEGQVQAAAAYAEALEAVRIADASRNNEDIAAAKTLVEALTDSTGKDRLMNRLVIIEAQEDTSVTYEEALAALRTADASRTSEDIEIARDLASQLENGWQKTRLENRLAVIDAQEA